SLWLGICRYTPDEWREHAEGPSRVEAIASYLRADIDLAIEVGDVRRWLGMLEPARVSLIEALGEPEDPESSSECVLLAIPFMPITPSKVEAIDALLDEFVAAVDAMGTDARAVLAEYGRRWEVLVDVALPVDRHTKIQICEQRPWINSPSPTLEHDIVFA